MLDEAGVVLFYNSREEMISQRSRDEVIGRNFFTEVAPCTQVQEFYGQFTEVITKVGGVANFGFTFDFPAHRRIVEITLTGFENQNQTLCLVSVKDLTEDEAVRERIVSSEKLREVGEVAAIVAHNFNNLLTVIGGNAELLQPLVTGERPQRFLDSILRSTADATLMVSRIKESTRQFPVETDAPCSIEVNEVVTGALTFVEPYLALTRKEKEIRVTTDLAEDLPPLSANAASLREVFVNLLRNAVDAIEAEGEIIIISKLTSDRVVVEIRDTGSGMTDEVKNKLFRPLFTTKGALGTGLGLAACHSIVQRHGGEIAFDSVVGIGSTFIVRLPHCQTHDRPRSDWLVSPLWRK